MGGRFRFELTGFVEVAAVGCSRGGRFGVAGLEASATPRVKSLSSRASEVLRGVHFGTLTTWKILRKFFSHIFSYRFSFPFCTRRKEESACEWEGA